ncbi:pentatricopeptide repeat-containing protein At3g61360 [Aristolochia californica]|uniref:pentatricopeptide repeat-containing protein At3g61360 n=1 Tax=Aristolochia californica TaxID=171875 RepID=UPI0035E17B6E
MIVSRKLQKLTAHFSVRTPLSLTFHSSFSSAPTQVPEADASSSIDCLAKLINDHPFPSESFHSFLRKHIQPLLISPFVVDSVLGRLFSGHANALKALELFRFSFQSPVHQPSPLALEKTLLFLTRIRHFDKSWELMQEVHQKQPSLITYKSLSILLLRYAKCKSFDDTLEMFDKMKRLCGKGKFGTDEYNILLRAFCTQRQMKEARAVFRKYHSLFEPNAKTFNILLLGFKESGNITAVELFYHEMIRRGFRPNHVTYGIRIDAYCKKGHLSDALRVTEEMEKAKISPTLETMTTLVYGAGIARNPIRARQLFEEISTRKLEPDIGSYNALLGSYVRVGDLKSGVELMNKMEELGVGCDDVTYHTMFWGMKKFDDIEGVCHMYSRMVTNKLVPKMRTVVMLMKLFCENGLCDLGLGLWVYLVENGCCPHGHSLDLLVTALCCRGRVEEAYKCVMQVVVRGRHPSEISFQVLEDFLMKMGKMKKLEDLNRMMRRLQTVMPLSRGNAVGLSTDVNLQG